jgi:hypothetical protein
LAGHGSPYTVQAHACAAGQIYLEQGRCRLKHIRYTTYSVLLAMKRIERTAGMDEFAFNDHVHLSGILVGAHASSLEVSDFKSHVSRREFDGVSFMFQA